MCAQNCLRAELVSILHFADYVLLCKLDLEICCIDIALLHYMRQTVTVEIRPVDTYKFFF